MRGVVVLALLALTAIASAGPADKHEPCALVIVVDRTLDAERLADLQAAITSGFQALDRGDQVAVVAFGATARVQLPLQSASPRTRLSGLRQTRSADLANALDTTYRVLRNVKRRLKRVLVITDGNSLLGVQPIAEKMRAAGITISALGYQSQNRDRLDAIASAGDGQRYLAERPAQVAAIIESQTRPTLVREPIAITFVIDRSISMQGPKLEAVKELARGCIELLPPDDIVAIVAFDRAAELVVDSKPAANRMSISNQIERITSADGTDLVAGLDLARQSLERASATVKRVILLSDGEGASDKVLEKAAELRGADITISVVVVGSTDTATHKMLSKVSEIGEGWFYVLEDLDSAAYLPRMILAPLL